jgi:hypothetical protein
VTIDPSQPEAAQGTAVPTRQVLITGEPWIAPLSGSSAAGSGALGLGMLESIDYAPAAAPDRTVRTALVQRGRFHDLFDAELVAIFATARSVS